MNVLASPIADGEASKAVEPRERALNHPPIPHQPLTGINPATSNSWCDGAAVALGAAAPMVISLIGMQRIGSVSGTITPMAYRWHGIEG